MVECVKSKGKRKDKARKIEKIKVIGNREEGRGMKIWGLVGEDG